MKIHPLRRVYIVEIKKRYGVKLWGDKTPNKTDIIADKIKRLGISYEDFVHLSVELWDKWSREQGHKYPYWNVITSDGSIERVQGLLDVDEDSRSQTDSDLFNIELSYASDYVAWYIGDSQYKPVRPSVNIPSRIKLDVAQRLCQIYGVQFVSSNYNDIAQVLDERLHRLYNGIS